MDGRTCKLLTSRDVARNCFFEFIFITEKLHVFVKAWRKQIKPIILLDNSDYPQACVRHGEWTIQTDGWFDEGRGAYTTIKENRSDAVCLKDINAHLEYTRKHYPDVPTYFFWQEYADYENDRKYSFARLKRYEDTACGVFLPGCNPPVYHEDMVRFLKDDERIAILKPSTRNQGYWQLDDGREVAVLGPGDRVVQDNDEIRWIYLKRGEYAHIVAPDGSSIYSDPWNED